jgi:uncharacterized protein
MFTRILTTELEQWKKNPARKPLIIRGARQVGKTTLVHMFAKSFDFYIHLNLDKRDDRQIFENHDNVHTILQLLLLRENISLQPQHSLLLFIDEIQNSPEAVRLLRYFHEEVPHLHVIAAGSLLETILDKQISFPVGRVEYQILRPFSFREYLMAKGETQALELFFTIPFPEYAHPRLLELFREYSLIGGMPEVVAHYLQHHDIVAVGRIFESLITTYTEDIEKYAATENERKVLRHIIRHAPAMAGERIRFEGFAASNYKSREVSEAFGTLIKTYLVSLVYPTTGTRIPLLENRRKSPKIQILDTGMVNYFAGMQYNLINSDLIDNVFDGRLAEHLAGQELLTISSSVLHTNHFWVREKKQSTAEVDFVVQVDDLLIPIEVKAGKTGRLRSLMAFIEAAPHPFGVRISSSKVHVEQLTTLNGKPFTLLNLPIYLAAQSYQYIRHYRDR